MLQFRERTAPEGTSTRSLFASISPETTWPLQRAHARSAMMAPSRKARATVVEGEGRGGRGGVTGGSAFVATAETCGDAIVVTSTVGCPGRFERKSRMAAALTIAPTAAAAHIDPARARRGREAIRSSLAGRTYVSSRSTSRCQVDFTSACARLDSVQRPQSFRCASKSAASASASSPLSRRDTKSASNPLLQTGVIGHLARALRGKNGSRTIIASSSILPCGSRDRTVASGHPRISATRDAGSSSRSMRVTTIRRIGACDRAAREDAAPAPAPSSRRGSPAWGRRGPRPSRSRDRTGATSASTNANDSSRRERKFGKRTWKIRAAFESPHAAQHVLQRRLGEIFEIVRRPDDASHGFTHVNDELGPRNRRGARMRTGDDPRAPLREHPPSGVSATRYVGAICYSVPCNAEVDRREQRKVRVEVHPGARCGHKRRILSSRGHWAVSEPWV